MPGLMDHAFKRFPKPVGPRVYGYYQDKVELDRPQGPGGCGTYFYWDGERCADARNKK